MNALTITRRASGIYQPEKRINGKRKRKSLGTTSYAEAVYRFKEIYSYFPPEQSAEIQPATIQL